MDILLICTLLGCIAVEQTNSKNQVVSNGIGKAFCQRFVAEHLDGLIGRDAC